MKGEYKMEQQKYQLNTLNISFPYEYAIETAEINWHDIFIAIENGFLFYKSAIAYASKELEKNENSSQTVINLAILSFDESLFSYSIHPYIDELANQISEEEKSKTNEKIMYILLKWVYEHRKDYDDPLGVIEFIYDDFGFPETIAHFVRWIPAKEPLSGSIEECIARLFDYWKQFLDEQQNKWGNFLK